GIVRLRAAKDGADHLNNLRGWCAGVQRVALTGDGAVGVEREEALGAADREAGRWEVGVEAVGAEEEQQAVADCDGWLAVEGLSAGSDSAAILSQADGQGREAARPGVHLD